MAIIKEKRKRYGIKALNKEENGRLKTRTAERIEISQATSNYWKWYREGGEEERGVQNRDEERREVWKRLKREILDLEEEGEWILDEDRLKRDEAADHEHPAVDHVKLE